MTFLVRYYTSCFKINGKLIIFPACANKILLDRVEEGRRGREGERERGKKRTSKGV